MSFKHFSSYKDAKDEDMGAAAQLMGRTKEEEENERKTKTTTHYLFLVEVPRTVGGGEGGGASLAVPGDIAVLGGAADGQGVDAIGVAVAVTAVLLPPSVPRSPHKDGAQTITTLENVQYIQTDRPPQTLSFIHAMDHH